MQAQPFSGRVSEPWDGSFALPETHSLPTAVLQEAAALYLWEGAVPLPSKKKGVNFLSFVKEKFRSVTIETGWSD